MAPVQPARPLLGDDMLYGVEEIRAFLSLKDTKAIYRLHEKGGSPIFKLEGVGFAARKSSLSAWIERKERAAMANSEAEG
jgi:hypothetical protein